MGGNEIVMTIEDVDTAMYVHFSDITIDGAPVPVFVYPPEQKKTSGKIYPSIEISPVTILVDDTRQDTEEKEEDSYDSTKTPPERLMRKRDAYNITYMLHAWSKGKPSKAAALTTAVLKKLGAGNGVVTVTNKEVPPESGAVWMFTRGQNFLDADDDGEFIFHRVWTLEIEATLTDVDTGAMKVVETVKWKFKQTDVVNGGDRTTVVDKDGNESVEPYN